MFLSRLRLDPRDLRVSRDLGDVAELHRTVMRGFPQHDGDSARHALGVLFRLEAGTMPPVLLVQSSVRPDWASLADGYLSEHDTKEITRVLDRLTPGLRLRFRLVANPSKKRAAHRPDEPPPRNSRRVALVGDERHRWLVGRAERGGFELDGSGVANGVLIHELPPMGRGGRGRRGIHVRPVLFEGALRVSDADRFRTAVRDGVGPAKAYGCGLLSVAPLR